MLSSKKRGAPHTTSSSVPPRRQRRLGTPLAAPVPPAPPVDLPVSRLTRSEQKKGMSCSLATMQSIGKAFGRVLIKFSSISKILKEAINILFYKL